MRKLILLALPLASIMLLAGCNESEYQSSRGSASPAVASQAQAPAPQQEYQPPARNSTTQSLPSGWGYLHERDLAGGRVNDGGATAVAARPGGS